MVAVVATYRRPQVARLALDALLAQTRPSDAIILVENTPESDFEGALPEGAVELVRPGWNTGAAGGFGIGADIALARGATHVVFVDDDCLLRPDTFEVLEREISTRLPHATLGPVVVSPDEQSFVWELYQPDGRPYANPADLPADPIPARDMAFHGLTVSADAIRKVGGPRKDLFFGGPDVEFCLRLAANGYPPFYVPGARAVHHEPHYRRFWLLGQRQVPAGTPGHRYYVLRNRLLMWRLYHREPLWNGVGKVIAREVAGALLCGDRWHRLRLLATAIREGLMGDAHRPMNNAVSLR